LNYESVAGRLSRIGFRRAHVYSRAAEPFQRFIIHPGEPLPEVFDITGCIGGKPFIHYRAIDAGTLGLLWLVSWSTMFLS
jgi:hypothetical protein